MDFWRVNSYGYPNVFNADSKVQKAWATLLSFYDHEGTSYSALEQFWHTRGYVKAGRARLLRLLADENLSRVHFTAVMPLHAAVLGIAVAAVAAGSCAFFVCHLIPRLWCCRRRRLSR